MIESDFNNLCLLVPDDIRSYLKSKKWVEDTTRYFAKTSIWKLNEHGKQYSVKLLEDKEYDDYRIRMSELITELSVVEKRPKDRIITDIQNISKDVWKIHLKEPLSQDGMLSLEKSVDVYEQIKNFFIAGAASANDIYVKKITPEEIYHNNNVDMIRNFRKQLRLGQTEVGSYVITVSSVINPPVGDTLMDLENNIVPDSFERNVNLTLACAISIFKKTYMDKINHPDDSSYNIIKLLYRNGLTVNLCEAISALSKVDDTFTELELECNWSKRYPTPSNTPDSIILSPEEIKYMADSARIYRGDKVKYDYEAKGYVYQLDREKKEPDGTIGLIVKIEGKEHHLKITLPYDGENSDYSKAVKAHHEMKSLKCVGNLKKKGMLYTLDNAHNVEIIDSE